MKKIIIKEKKFLDFKKRVCYYDNIKHSKGEKRRRGFDKREKIS